MADFTSLEKTSLQNAIENEMRRVMGNSSHISCEGCASRARADAAEKLSALEHASVKIGIPINEELKTGWRNKLQYYSYS